MGIPSQCHWICLILRNMNIYCLGEGSEWFLRYKIFNEMEGVKHPMGGNLSVSLDLSYHKEDEYIWFRGGDLNDF